MTAKKPRMGRPPRTAKPASRRVEIKLTDAEGAAWDKAAAREGLTLSAWLRAAAELAIARGATR